MVTIHPVPSTALTSATARHPTPYGEVRVAWTRADGCFRLDARVPVETPRRSGCPAPTRTRPSHTASIAGRCPTPSRPPPSRRRRSPSAMCSTNRRPGPR
ncbi:alpha-L-rhamnosidase C-terminal domain-containing protein [Streptomyces sp. NBC_00481]|uniref:alpha-L-rhamnosidase C-terminal domain-containing protein n=1 Tax=Streptomyces sp. NBC_00481 TaxID=2975755 RepID=UPI003FA3970D